MGGRKSSVDKRKENSHPTFIFSSSSSKKHHHHQHHHHHHHKQDSFHQLRSKLSVTFVGEEGIDAGGVAREWYSVVARGAFDPNLSLFAPTPEGGTAFQPNPASVVQSDPARGTTHLDFFRFVGRIVGKALRDGQPIDAYFTR